MRIITAEEIKERVSPSEAIEALRAAFATGGQVPERLHYTLPNSDSAADGTLLIMPAWTGKGGPAGIKTVSVFPDNIKRGLPSVMGLYTLLNGATGEPLSIADGAALTLVRTAAVSALAADYLSKPDARTHLVLGAGRLAAPIARAMCAVRSIETTLIWARRRDQAEGVVNTLRSEGLDARVVQDRVDAVADAEIVSTVTLATEPVVEGAWLSPGTHLDLVGSFRPDMREADNAVMRSGQIYVDTLDGACRESGDLVQPLEAGVIQRSDILGSLEDLASRCIPGRTRDEAITVFKSVGTALADLAVAQLIQDKVVMVSP